MIFSFRLGDTYSIYFWIYLSISGDGNGYIPNTVELGGSTIDLIELKRQFLPKLLLLTGPNMVSQECTSSGMFIKEYMYLIGW